MNLFARPTQAAAAPLADGMQPQVVWGGQWFAIEPSASASLAQAAQREARRRGAAAYALVATEQDAFLGVPPRGKGQRLPGQGKGGSYLAGQLLASVPGAQEIAYLGGPAALTQNRWTDAQAIAWLGTAEAGQLALVAVLGGIPCLELVGEPAAVRVGLDEFAEHLLRGGILLVEDGAATASVLAGMTNQARRESVPGLPYDSRLVERCQPLQPLGLAPVVRSAVWLAAVLALGALAASAYEYQQRAALSVQSLSRKEQQARVARSGYLQAQAEALAREESVLAAAAAMPLWQFLAQAPVARAGFRLQKVVCTGGRCELFYRRAAKSMTFEDFVQAHRTGERPKFDIAQLDDASTLVQVEGFAQLPRLELSALSQDPGLLLKLGTTAQKVQLAGVRLSFSTPADLVAPSPEHGRMRPGELEALRRWQGRWTLEGPTDTLVPALRRLPPSSTLSSLEVALASEDRNGIDTVVARGRYFVAAGEPQ